MARTPLGFIGLDLMGQGMSSTLPNKGVALTRTPKEAAESRLNGHVGMKSAPFLKTGERMRLSIGASVSRVRM